MPELPEVYTFIQQLKKLKVVGQTIKDIKYYDSKVLQNSTESSFKKFIIGETIKDINQIGKLIVFSLSHDKYLTIHLRMEGKLFFQPINTSVYKNTMVEFICGSHKLVYLDMRKFGTFYIYKSTKEFKESDEVSKLGPQPWDKQLTAQYLLDCFKNKSLAIKTALLDQTIIAGIGNIYADEICFACGLNPKTPAKSLSLKDCQNIIKATQNILDKAKKCHGTTVSTFAFAPNHAGEFQKYLMVHTREGEKCKKCGSTIIKIKVNGRGTYYCPKCQK